MSSESVHAMPSQASQRSTPHETAASIESASEFMSQVPPNNTVGQTNTVSPSVNVHSLRSSTTYVDSDDYLPQASLNTTLYKAFRYFQSGSPIPQSLLEKTAFIPC